MFDFIAVSGEQRGRAIEYIDHLHEHFVDPVAVRGGRYRAPTAPGFSAEINEQSLTDYQFPLGPIWAGQTRIAEAPEPLKGVLRSDRLVHNALRSRSRAKAFEKQPPRRRARH